MIDTLKDLEEVFNGVFREWGRRVGDIPTEADFVLLSQDMKRAADGYINDLLQDRLAAARSRRERRLISARFQSIRLELELSVTKMVAGLAGSGTLCYSDAVVATGPAAANDNS